MGFPAEFCKQKKTRTLFKSPGWNRGDISGLRPWALGNPRIADSGQACPMPLPCRMGRQTLPAWEPPCPLERPSPALALVQVQEPP